MTITPTLLSGSPVTPVSKTGTVRRRMNPDSLAVRLGAELIKELEALLEPGMTEMPSFSVRQKIQKRYHIDRRHIYHWFHNKGLRVASAEKREEKRIAKTQDGKDSDSRVVQVSGTVSHQWYGMMIMYIVCSPPSRSGRGPLGSTPPQRLFILRQVILP